MSGDLATGHDAGSDSRTIADIGLRGNQCTHVLIPSLTDSHPDNIRPVSASLAPCVCPPGRRMSPSAVQLSTSQVASVHGRSAFLSPSLAIGLNHH